MSRRCSAAPTGSRELAFAIVAMTVTLTGVYAPIAFETGRTCHLIVEFADQSFAQGLNRRAAAERAALLRLRPILMTTAAMVLGAVPLALAEGAGAESRQQIGWVIVDGLLLGTLLTLYVVPTAYMLLARTHRPPEAAVVPAAAPAEERRAVLACCTAYVYTYPAEHGAERSTVNITLSVDEKTVK